MIQEQVALYLGIKSFKRKYPDLPRRQIDMEERNYLQEKGLVSERMCDLGITAVWASDILDIMYADFYEKYEEYKDYIRQKHLREIEAKQKALGLNVTGRGLNARDRAMLSASKWNAYFNKKYDFFLLYHKLKEIINLCFFLTVARKNVSAVWICKHLLLMCHYPPQCPSAQLLIDPWLRLWPKQHMKKKFLNLQHYCQLA